MIKGVIQNHRIPMNKYAVNIQPGIGLIMFVSVGEIEAVLDSTTLPDATRRSGGRIQPIETDLVQPAHHTADVIKMNVWWLECQDPVSPTHLKLLTITQFDVHSIPRRQIILTNAWLTKKTEGAHELENEGDMQTITWGLSADEPLP